jgi:hypothetical protein
MTTEGIDHMKNKPSFFMLAAGAFALMAMIAYLFFALMLADHWETAPVPPNKAETTKPPM